MNFLRRNIWHLSGYAILLSLFSVSIVVRKDDLKTDLGRHHEWITAHALITMEIWEQNGGPAEFGFNPIYTYPDGYVFPRTSLGGVTDENGHNYYVSYPPFAFIFGYYATQILGGPDVGSIRTLNLIVHFLCGLFIYLIFARILARKGHYKFNFPGLIAAGIYFLSTGTLWAHSMLFFVDTLGQLWIIMLIYLGLKLFNTTNKLWPLLTGLFVISFLACYTEWLGIFLSFFGGIALFLVWLKQRQKQFLLAFLILGLSSSLALTITIAQYSSIAGWDELKKASLEKYEERGGHTTDNPRLIHHSGNPETFQMIRKVFDQQYLMAEQLFFYTGIGFLIVVVLPATRRKMTDVLLPWLFVAVPLLAILLHYTLFLNFNALHDFSAIKFGFIVSIAVGVTCHFILMVFPDLKIRLGIGAILSALFIFAASDAVRRFHEKYPVAALDKEWFQSCQQISAAQEPEKAIFIDRFFLPEASYYIKRDYFPAYDSLTVHNLMLGWHISDAQYFIHEGPKLVEMREYEVVNKWVILTRKVRF
jgi:hypothetical protein